MSKIFKQDFEILAQDPTPPKTIRERMGDCEYSLPALAELGEKTEDLFNDWHRFIAFFPSIVTSAVAKLLKPDGTEVDLATYGSVTTLGYFTNQFNQKPFAGYVDWHTVINDLGVGCYRIILRGTYPGGTIEHKSFKFQLLPYNDGTADETVRFDWVLTGKLGSDKSEQILRDFAKQEFDNRLRLPCAWFGLDKSDSEYESVRYRNGQKVYTSQKRNTKYTFKSGFYPYAIHQYIQFDIMMGEAVEITDYNSENPTLHTNTAIVNFGEYAPNWNALSALAKVEVECESEFENHIKLR